MTDTEIRSILDKESLSESVWAMAIVVAANLLAPAFGAPLTGTAIAPANATAPCADQVVQLAEALGCASWVISPEARPVSGVVEDLEHEHGWPLMLQPPGAAGNRGAWLKPLTRTSERNLLVSVDQLGAMAMASRGGWHVIKFLPLSRLPSGVPAIGKIIPNYLQWMCEHRLQLPRSLGHFGGVVHSMADWFDDIGGRGDDVTDSQRSLLPAISISDTHGIAERIRELLREIDNSNTATGFGHKNKLESRQNERATLFSGRYLACALGDTDAGYAISVSDIREALTRAEVVVVDNGSRSHGDRNYGGVWSVDTAWWNSAAG